MLGRASWSCARRLVLLLLSTTLCFWLQGASQTTFPWCSPRSHLGVGPPFLQSAAGPCAIWSAAGITLVPFGMGLKPLLMLRGAHSNYVSEQHMVIKCSHLCAGFCNEEQLLAMLPPTPPVSYQNYTPKIQSSKENTVRPSRLKPWENFVQLSHSMALNTAQPLPMPRRRWMQSIEGLVPENMVWDATQQFFYLPLTDASEQLDGPSQHCWKNCSSPSTNCDAFLKIRGSAVAIGQALLQHHASLLGHTRLPLCLNAPVIVGAMHKAEPVSVSHC